LLPLAFGVSGCAVNPVYLAERPLLTQQLPQGISMSDYVEPGPFGTRITVAEKLAWLGARPGVDGKIHDLMGNEIAFWPDQSTGIDPGPEFCQRQEEALDELRKRCRVIIMQRDPRLPLVQ
jgi:hypothetical protein